MNKRNRYTPEFKAKVILEVPAEEKTVNQIAAKYGFSPVVNNAGKGMNWIFPKNF